MTHHRTRYFFFGSSGFQWLLNVIDPYLAEGWKCTEANAERCWFWWKFSFTVEKEDD